MREKKIKENYQYNTAVGEHIARSASEPTDGYEVGAKRRQSYIDLAKQFIDEHNENKDWSIFDRLETMAIVMFAKWLDSKKAKNMPEDERIGRRG